MLVLSRKSRGKLTASQKGQSRIVIADDIAIEILSISGSTVRVGVDAPRSMNIQRGEHILEVDSVAASV